MKNLILLDKPLQISEEREAYNRYRLLFMAEADRAQERFEQVYETCHSIDDVVQRTPKQAMECIDPVIKMCVQTLLKHNILSVDEASFKERYPGYCSVWEEAFLTVYDRYAEIVMDQKQLDEYRVARRQNRARWHAEQRQNHGFRGTAPNSRHPVLPAESLSGGMVPLAIFPVTPEKMAIRCAGILKRRIFRRK